MLTPTLHCYMLEGQSAPKKGRMVAMSDFLELRWILDMKVVSVLNWKNIAQPKKRKMVSDQQILSVQLRQFLV